MIEIAKSLGDYNNIVKQGSIHHCSTCHRDFVCDSENCILDAIYPCCNCDYNNQHMVSEYVETTEIVKCTCKK